jgi:hypothetical protein
MLNEQDDQLDAEQHTSGEQSIWRAVYNLMHCPSPSCHLGPHCWQDPHGKKHYQLRTHHLKRLTAYVEGVGILQCQDDLPDAVREELFLEEQQRLESNRALALFTCLQRCLFVYSTCVLQRNFYMSTTPLIRARRSLSRFSTRRQSHGQSL